MADPNRHGVFVNCEKVVFYDDGRSIAAVCLAGYQGCWYGAFTIYVCSRDVGGGGSGSLPSLAGKPFLSRDMALNWSRLQLQKRLECWDIGSRTRQKVATMLAAVRGAQPQPLPGFK